VLGGSLKELPKLLKADATLRARIVEDLLLLATPTRVHAVRANAVLGEIWRAISVFGKGDEKVQELYDRLTAAVQGDPEMQAWVESTYNTQACLFHPPPQPKGLCSLKRTSRLGLKCLFYKLRQ
jgi:hypothetical protein